MTSLRLLAAFPRRLFAVSESQRDLGWFRRLVVLAAVSLAGAILAQPAQAQVQSCSDPLLIGGGTQLESAPTLASLPSAAQPVVSAALGRNDARYHATQLGEALRLSNRAHALDVRFTPQGMQVSVGQQHWGLALRAYGYGERLEPAPAAAPQNQANRVEYRRGRLVEWYVNGPLGLEQGFTLTRPPDGKRGKKNEPLTLALALEGDLQASLDPAQNGQKAGPARGLTLRDASGRSVLRYGGLTAHDSRGRKLLAWVEMGQKELLLRVADAGARYPVVVDPLIEQAQLVIGESDRDLLGVSIAVSGDGKTIAVSVLGKYLTGSGDPLHGQGFVYVFEFVQTSGGTFVWHESGYLGSDELFIDPPEFGLSVAVSCNGSTIAVGAPGTEVSTNSSKRQGAAYVFVKPASGWGRTSPTAKLAASDAPPSGLGIIGNSVAISADGSTIVAGAPAAAGAAYVFVKSFGGWASGNEVAKLTASDGATGNYLGWSVGISNDGGSIVAGAPGFNQGPGAAYVFVKSAGWASRNETAKLTASDGANGDQLGTSVAIGGGGTVVAGAPNATIGSNQAQGAAYVFVKPAGGWFSGIETAKLTASDGENFSLFGKSIAITSGSTGLLSPPQVILVSATSSFQGAVYAFFRPSNGWTTTSTFGDKLVAFDAYAFGYSLSVGLDLTTIAVGTPYAYNGRGTAYTFTGVATASPSAGNLNFGNVAVGTTATRTVTLTNNGPFQPLNVTRVEVGSVDLNFNFIPVFPTQSVDFPSILNPKCVAASPLAPGASCTETVSFAPSSPGAKDAMLVFTDDSNGLTGNTQIVQLGGTGIIKVLSATSIASLTPSPSLKGESVAVGYSVVPHAGSSLSPTGAVSITATTGESCVGLAPSGACTLTFHTVGQRTITAAYLGNDSLTASTSTPASQNVMNFTLVASPASQTIAPNHKASYTLTLRSVNGFSGATSLTCSGGPPGSTCSVTPSSLSGAGTAKATLTSGSPDCATHGTFPVTFTASHGGVDRTATATVTISR